MKTILARSPSDLLRLLVQMDISVPPRTEGRTTEHCERWTICRFLATFADSLLLRYPLRVTHRDRPDFLVSMATAHIGIEVTEAIPQDEARATALAEYRGYDGLRFSERFVPGETRRSLQQIDAIARGKVSTEGWTGDTVEQDWADAMLYFSLRKVERYEDSGFEKFDETWLMIEDNWPLPEVEEAKASEYLLSHLCTLAQPLPFSLIFVHLGNSIWRFGTPSCSKVAVNNIWRDS